MEINKKTKSNIIFYAIFASVVIFLFFTPWGGSFRSWMMSFTLSTPDIAATTIDSNEEAFISMDWAVVNEKEESIWLSQIDKPIFLNIWATWCGPCRSEMASIVALQKKYGDKIEFLLVSPSENIEVVRKFKETEGIEFSLYVNGSSIPQNLYSSSYPTTFIIDKNKRIVNKFIGAYNWNTDEVFVLLNRLL